jgi:hypothetical protein
MSIIISFLYNFSHTLKPRNVKIAFEGVLETERPMPRVQSLQVYVLVAAVGKFCQKGDSIITTIMEETCLVLTLKV